MRTHLELPLAELRLVEMQPVEGAMDGGEGGEACDADAGRRRSRVSLRASGTRGAI